jgi:ABC-type Fe3+/spermidine/putrescine transport system ATPase subunit
VLRIESLRKAWPDFELLADLSLGDAEIGAVLGPSGSGKSSLLRLVAGLERPDSGRVVLDGADLGPLPPERRRIGMVFQDYALFPARTVAGNISYGPAVAGLPRAERNRITRTLADELGIAGLLGRYPASLSGGERQRVALARTLAARPALVLLDEPLSSLDEGTRKRLRLDIAERLRGSGTAALHVTHDVEEALAIADRLFLMRDGRVEASGVPESIYAQPPSAWAASFMGSGPVMPALSIEGPASAPRARSAFGTFACREASFDFSRDERCSIFFPSAAVALVADADSPREGVAEGINRFTCRVVSSFFAGRSRRVILGREFPAGEARIEVDLPVSARVSRGEEVRLGVPVSSCSLLRGIPSADVPGE